MKIDRSNSFRLNSYLIYDYRFTLNISKSYKVNNYKNKGEGGVKILGEF